MGNAIRQILFLAELFLWMWGVLQMDVTKSKKRIAVCAALLSLFLTCEGKINAAEDFVLCEMAFSAMLAAVAFEGKIWIIQLKFWFAVFSMDFVSGPISMVFHLAESYIDISWWEDYQTIIYEIILIITITAITFLIKKSEHLKYKIKGLPAHYFAIGLLICFFGSGIRMFVRIFAQGTSETVKKFSEILCVGLNESIYLLAISFVAVNDLRARYLRESQTKDKHIEMLKEYYQLQEQHVREMRKIRHDIKNHLLIVREYLELDKAEEAKQYLDQIEKDLWRGKEKCLNVGNDVVSAVLSSEKRKAGDGILFHCEGKIPEEKRISDYDLCVIFSNLLSNAREACERLEKTEKKITVVVKTYQTRIYVSVENPVEWQVNVEKLGRYTSKSDKKEHGLGLQNVIETVERNNGEIFFEVKEGKFVVKVLV